MRVIDEIEKCGKGLAGAVLDLDTNHCHDDAPGFLYSER
jgi:hypothetical protein